MSRGPIQCFLAAAIVFSALAASAALGAPAPQRLAAAVPHRLAHRHRHRHRDGRRRAHHGHRAADRRQRRRHRLHHRRKAVHHPSVAPARALVAPTAGAAPAANTPFLPVLAAAGVLASNPIAGAQNPAKEKTGGEKPGLEEHGSEKPGGEKPGGEEHGSQGESEEESTPPPPPRKPADLKRPAISGTPRQGDRLTAATGVWEGEPTSYAYQWMVCNAAGVQCTAIKGATGSGYTLGAANVGHTMLVAVTATNSAGSTTANSAASPKIAEAQSPPPPAPTEKSPPTIAGEAIEGQQLSATAGTWAGSPTRYEYQWELCNASGEACATLAGETGSTYTLSAADVGHTLRVTVTASNAGGSEPASSVASATIVEAASPPPPPPAPTEKSPPTIEGEAIEGRSLSANRGTWTGSPTRYEYQWELCNASGEACVAIAGASGSSYRATPAEVGDTLRVTVTAANAGGSTPAGSAASATIAAAAKQPPPSPACTQTVASVSAAASALASASGGSAICLSAGSYGHLTLSGTHSANATIEPVPGSSASLEGVTVDAGADYITIHNFDISGGVSLQANVSHVDVDHNDIDGEGAGGDGEGVETLSVNCTAPNAPTYSGCTSTAPDTYLTINGNEIHGYGQGDTEDAIHLNDWEHVTITDNDIYKLEEHGNHTDAMQSVFGGHYMTFERNFEHDNQSQGFFIKDGDVSEVTVDDNLFLRNNNEPELYPGGEYNIQVFDTTGLTIANNTVWDGQDDILRAEGAAEALSATVSHNVEQTLDVLHESGPAYTLSENDDVFAEEPWTFKMGAQSIVERQPDFADTASEDYELASNPDGDGVDWQPSEYVYGPTGH
jgi:hypothetical protein